MKLLDATALARLQHEFRQSMRKLLMDLCLDMESQYLNLAEQFELPVPYFRFLSQSFDLASYSNWKVVGWIEALNDLGYFLDLLSQIRKETDLNAFGEELLAECEQKFFENSYLDELFPKGQAESKGLATRLESLCLRLTREVTQEALFFDPRWAMQWKRRQGLTPWTVSGNLDQHFERAERAFSQAVGMVGDELVAPPSVVKAIGQPTRRLYFEVTRHEIALKKGRAIFICRLEGTNVRWYWQRRPAVAAARTMSGSLTVGPTLHYGKDRQPKSVTAINRQQVARIAQAWDVIKQAWPDGYALLELLTARIIPLKAAGVVSFSYRHRPGLSFINCFDRDNLDLIDDLIHENSHHHLNLLLRKHVMYHGDHNQQIFYSPWRRSLRPVRGILHAAFTFTMGALLFERLSSWADTKEGRKAWKQAGLTQRHLLRARFRCLEEIESVRYSIEDLDYAGRHLRWLTGSGARLVRQLDEAIAMAEEKIHRRRSTVLASRFGPALRKHVEELKQARQTYGPLNLHRT
jgi:HEXXH motif-containing protein